MGTNNYSDDFKRDAVHQIAVRGYALAPVQSEAAVS
jgi:transposase